MSGTTRDSSALFSQSNTVRRSILAAYWIAIFLALPLWWSTTSIKRLSLPASQVASHARKDLRIPIRLSFETGSGNDSSAHAFPDILEKNIMSSPERWKSFEVLVENNRPAGTEDNIYTIVTNGAVASVKNRQLTYPVHPSPSEPLSEPDKKDRIVSEVKTFSGLVDTLVKLLAPFPSTSQHDHRVLPYSPRYRLSFSLLHEDASAGHYFKQWDIEDSISRHIIPITSQLTVLHNFTIESQVQFHARLAFNPRPFDDAFGISPEDLSIFVNTAEWTLSSSASNDPVIHFVLFIPSASRRPLYILDESDSFSHSNAFLVPQWGGIVIHNPGTEPTSPETLCHHTLDPIFAAFSSHFLALLGVPPLPRSILESDVSATQRLLTDTEMERKALTDWQFDALLRYRAVSNFQGSRNTLQSIVKLVDQIDNMPVGQDVKGDVQIALSALEQMFEASSQSLTDTFRHSAHAFKFSSRAFFNPGMLALLYFPAEHKYAVYTPLFASAFIPLFVAALREVRAWRKQRKVNINIPVPSVG